jgi:hypothetical protein
MPQKENVAAYLEDMSLVESQLTFLRNISMEVICSLETLVDLRRITWCCITEDSTLVSPRLLSCLAVKL